MVCVELGHKIHQAARLWTISTLWVLSLVWRSHTPVGNEPGIDKPFLEFEGT